MKKILISASLAAVGTAGLSAAYASDMNEDSKVWTLSASLRGFYDDNYNTSGTSRKESSGFQLSPELEINKPMEQTQLGLRYIYGLTYYQDRDRLNQSPYDQTHLFDLWLDHAFSQRWQGKVQDTFVVAQDPQLLTPSTVPTAVVQRVNGNNISNRAKFDLQTLWTRLFSTEVTYQNSFYDYMNSGAGITGTGLATTVQPSLAGTLNRDENTVSVDFQFHVLQTTTLFFGYQYGQVNYDGNEVIAFDKFTGTFYTSSSRDSRSHYGYVGVQHEFLENLNGNARVGMQYSKYYNDPNASSSTSPYANASLIYTYASGSYAQVGVTHSRNATVQSALDVFGHLTQDQESTVIYTSVNHLLTPKLTAGGTFSFQNSSYHNGAYNNMTDNYYTLGLNLDYKFNHHFSAEAGYNYDNSASVVPGASYTRDRIYLGVTASY